MDEWERGRNLKFEYITRTKHSREKYTYAIVYEVAILSIYSV